MDRMLLFGYTVSRFCRACLDAILMLYRVATALRRMQLVKWQPYMDESLHILETHPDALPSDRQVIWWAKLAYVMEQAGVQLTAEDPHSEISFADSKTRYTIKAFANQLAQFRRDIPEEFWTGQSIVYHPCLILLRLI